MGQKFEKPIELPDILAEFYKYERWHWQHLPWRGAMEDQPWQLMFELDCVSEALEAQERLNRQAAEIQAAQANQQQPTQRWGPA